jgi:hypothetical protein
VGKARHSAQPDRCPHHKPHGGGNTYALERALDEDMLLTSIFETAWRRFLKPRLGRLISSIKTIRPGLKVAYHSDVCIYPIIGPTHHIQLDTPVENLLALVDAARGTRYPIVD